MVRMDSTIRNLDAAAYRRLKAHAALTGRPIGEVVSEAIRLYLDRQEPTRRGRSLSELPIEEYAVGSERLSEEIDAIVYRTRSGTR